MQKPYKNICYRCGKERIVTRTWKEKVNNSIVENVETACPDKACQEAINKDLLKQKNKRIQMEERKIESAKNRKLAIHKKNSQGVKRKNG